MSKLRTSILQVAERAGVSPMTVSRVLREGEAAVRPATRRRVLEAVKELEYIPVPYMAQNRQVKTNVIGFIPYQFGNRDSVEERTIAGISRAAHEADYDLLWILRKEREWHADVPHAAFMDRRADGYIFTNRVAGEWNAVLAALDHADIKAVACFVDDVPEGIAYVDPDNERLASAAIEHLYDRGHRNVCYIDGITIPQYEHNRLPDYRPTRKHDDFKREEAARRAWLRLTGSIDGFHLIDVNDPATPLTGALLEMLVRRGITGALCFNDEAAVVLLRSAQHLGVSIPRDLSIVGIDNTPEGQECGLTSADYGGFEAVGQGAVQAIVDMLAGKSAEHASRRLFTGLVERATVTQPRLP
ncbi:MAG: LacI family DNA-binding transcriptional regulator [Capsulimonadaceae bacterium]|nr:LacI family DNA-binding transcriptional regulator [Capsulimonadaceae bacterium]